MLQRFCVLVNVENTSAVKSLKTTHEQPQHRSVAKNMKKRKLDFGVDQIEEYERLNRQS